MRASLSARLIASASVSLSVLDADDIDLSVFSGTVSGIEVARRDDGGPTSMLNETSASGLAAEGRLPGGRLLASGQVFRRQVPSLESRVGWWFPSSGPMPAPKSRSSHWLLTSEFRSLILS